MNEAGNALSCLRKQENGLLVFMRLSPRSARDEISGVEKGADSGTYIAARVRAVPEKGAANTALIKLFSKWLGVPKSSVSIRSGATSRVKTLHIEGDAAALAKALESRLGETRRR
jgi:uncharacterized protein (TIGR00251 family)